MENGEISYKILAPNISEEHLRDFVDIINTEWGDFFYLTEEVFLKRLSSRGLFIGAYHNGFPAGVLETIGLCINGLESLNGNNPEERAEIICSKIGNYDELTNGGLWRPHPEYTNTLVLVDITRDLSLKGLPIAPGIVDFNKSLMLREPEHRPEQLTDLEYAISLTPNVKPLIRWHERQWAFDTGVVLEDARPGYKEPDVNFMCYMAPGYKPNLGQREISS